MKLSKRETSMLPKIVDWNQSCLHILDQSLLPREEVQLKLRTPNEVSTAIKEMKIRGAPAIGIAAAYGLLLAAINSRDQEYAELINNLKFTYNDLMNTRPTAFNLRWALDRMMALAISTSSKDQIEHLLAKEARNIHKQTEESDIAISELGATLLQQGSKILTHCNTGALATGGQGTALGIIRKAWELGLVDHVIATETRPWLQGARLTAWELKRASIPFTIIVDSAAAHLMDVTQINCVIVGADRIASNGDTANKIGTRSLAILASESNIPFYVAAPSSTVDLSINHGHQIIVEDRPAEEVTSLNGISITPPDTHAFNPAFDITPHRYINAIVTDKGIALPPYEFSLTKLVHND